MSGIKEMIRGFQQSDALYDAKEELRKENKMKSGRKIFVKHKTPGEIERILNAEGEG